MKRYKIIAYLVVWLFGISNCTSVKSTGPEEVSKTDDYLRDSLIIYYDPQIGKAELLKKIAVYGAVAKYQYGIIDAVAVTLPKNKTVSEAEAYFRKVKGVLQVQKDYIQKIQ